jgi:hypothetical protein
MSPTRKDGPGQRDRGGSPGEMARFVATAVELRSKANTNLSTILTAAELTLEKADLPPEVRRRLESIQAAALEMRALLKELDRTDSRTRSFLERQKKPR